MSNETPTKNKRARSDSLSPSTGAEPKPPYSPKHTAPLPPASPSQPPSHTSFPSSMPSTGSAPVKERAVQDSSDDTMVSHGPKNKSQTKDSPTATSDPKLETKAMLAAGPTSGSYGSKPLEPGYATAGLDLTMPSREQGTATTREFKTRTDGGAGAGGDVKGDEGRVLSSFETLKHESDALAEEIKRAAEALMADEDDETVVEKAEKMG